MVTLKQIEAFYWACTLGSFEAAAQKLNTAQSTISKRIQEFEIHSKVLLFDRTKRTVRLTMKGQELLRHAEEMLNRRNAMVLSLRDPEAYSGRFRFGVTELIALTWLPRLITQIKAKYPNLNLLFQVDTALKLYERLSDHRIDLVLATPGRHHLAFERIPLTDLELAWMASPGLVSGERLSLQDVASHTLLAQVNSSGMQVMVEQLLHDNDAKARNIVACNSMSALGELAAAGLGIACLPRAYFEPKIRSGALRVIESDPPIPKLPYVAAFREDAAELSGDIAAMAVEVCNFDHPRLNMRKARLAGSPPDQAE